LLAASIVANKHDEYLNALLNYRAKQTKNVLDNPDPRADNG